MELKPSEYSSLVKWHQEQSEQQTQFLRENIVCLTNILSMVLNNLTTVKDIEDITDLFTHKMEQ